jgi:hypothetical protein
MPASVAFNVEPVIEHPPVAENTTLPPGALAPKIRLCPTANESGGGVVKVIVCGAGFTVNSKF